MRDYFDIFLLNLLMAPIVLIGNFCDTFYIVIIDLIHVYKKQYCIQGIHRDLYEEQVPENDFL